VDDLVAEPHELAALAVRRDVADLRLAVPSGLLEEEPQVVVGVETTIDQIDADPFPRQRLADGLQIGQDRRLFVQELAFRVPHGLEDDEARHG
jgi:hypothetical protein